MKRMLQMNVLFLLALFVSLFGNPLAMAATAKSGKVPANDSTKSTNEDPRQLVVPSNEIDRVIAIVNREVITERELQNRMKQYQIQFVQEKRPMPSNIELQKLSLERLIDESIIFQEATISSVRVLDGEIDETIKNIAGQKKLTVDQLKIAIEKEGTSFDKYKENIKREMIMNRYRQKAVEAKIKISDADIDTYISQRVKPPVAATSAATSSQEGFYFIQILVPVSQGASPTELSTAKAKAETIYKDAENANDFMKFAAQLSQADKSVRVQDLGYRSIDRLPQLFVEAAGKTSVGKLAPNVIQGPAGFHILKLMDHKGGSVTSNTDVGNGSILIIQNEISHIMITSKSGASDEDIQRRLNVYRNQVNSKTADFGELAKKYSEDSATAPKKGYLGVISPGQSLPEFDIAMKDLKPGEVSAPFKTEFGWHIIYLMNQRKTELTSNQQKEYARAALRQSRLDQAYQDWIRELRDNATIELRPPYNMSK